MIAAQILQVDEVGFVRGKKAVRIEQPDKLADIIRADNGLALNVYLSKLPQALASDDVFNFEKFHTIHRGYAHEFGREALYTRKRKERRIHPHIGYSGSQAVVMVRTLRLQRAEMHTRRQGRRVGV